MSLIDSLPRVRALKLPRADGLIQWIVPLAIVLVWQAACQTGFVPVRVLPAPSDVALAGWKLLLSGELARNIWSASGAPASDLPLAAALALRLVCVTSC